MPRCRSVVLEGDRARGRAPGPVTVAVKVTDSPKTVGVPEVAIVVVDGFLLTVRVPAPLTVCGPLARTLNEYVPAATDAATLTVNVPAASSQLLTVTGFVENDGVAPAGSPDVTLSVSLSVELLPWHAMVNANVAEPAVPVVTVPVCEPTLTLSSVIAAATYGPTIGPPEPSGPAPFGSRDDVPSVSATARSRFSRPLPVSDVVPAASAVRRDATRSRRWTPTGPPLAAAQPPPATSAADADVPVIEVEPPPGEVVRIPTPGAARNASSPKFELGASVSELSVFETPMTPRSPAGIGHGRRAVVAGRSDDHHVR